MKRIASGMLCLLLLAQSYPLSAQESNILDTALVIKPSEENFASRWLVVGVGSFPITLFYTNIAFSAASYISSGFDQAYAPWPFGDPQQVALPTQDRFMRLGIAFASSAIIGLIDAIIVASLKHPQTPEP